MKKEEMKGKVPPIRLGAKDRYSNIGAEKQKVSNKDIEDTHGIMIKKVTD